MTKTWYNKTTGSGAIFEDAEDMSKWPAFQADRVAATATQVRAERDAKLAACDWRASSDVTLSTEWRTYRQALRDVPSQLPGAITWPTEPT